MVWKGSVKRRHIEVADVIGGKDDGGFTSLRFPNLPRQGQVMAIREASPPDAETCSETIAPASPAHSDIGDR